MFDTTVHEASTLLGVSVGRVHQLIKSGQLPAEQLAGIWLIDRNSVLTRAANKPQPGRPSDPSGFRRAARFLLMNRTHEVLSFKFDASTGEFFEADEIIDAARAPLSVMSPRGTRASKVALSYWWAHRTIPKARTGIEEKLRELGIADTYDLPFRSLGLSLSDQYWVKPYDSDLRWEDVNFFQNDFAETEAGDWLAEVGLDSPDNTSDGVLSKRWICEDGKRVLLKGGTLLEQEPFNEAIATELHRRLLTSGEYVPYELRQWNDSYVSACPNFLSSTEELIPAYYVNEVRPRDDRANSYRHYVDCCHALGVENIEDALGKMIVCDYLVANTDRHWRNFGLVRDVETLEYRPAPLFDSGSSLWCRVPTREL
ncbi:MAG: helix-turn-helix domain-containing protein, partial [Adlercreutzia sp.]|nr:helix-turn-helix domain-containing protein [Adlercreutzia sp.]